MALRVNTKLSASLALGALFCALGSSGVDGGQVQGQRSDGGHLVSSSELLVQSYLSGAKFAPEERAYQLALLSGAAARVDPGLLRLWSEELLQLSSRFPPSWDRTANQKNALVALSQVDPRKALELLRVLDPPEGSDLPEDLRAFGARAVFERYWKSEGRGGLDDVRETARRIGDTGEYPYAAMGPIVNDVAKQDPTTAQSLFTEALSYYGVDSLFRDSDKEFVGLLLAVWSIVPLDLGREALKVVVAHLTRKPSGEDEHFKGTVLTDQGPIQVTSRSQALLYKVLPRIQEVDPEWAKQVLSNLPRNWHSPSQAPDVKNSEGSVVVNTSSASPDAVSAAEARAQAEARLGTIESIAAAHPEEAYKLSQGLADPAYRLAGLASSAAGFGARDPKRASDILAQLKEQVEAITDKIGKVKALAALEEAASSLGDRAASRDALREGLSLGEELFQEDLDTHPAKLSYQTDVYDDLQRLARVGGRADAENTLAAVTKVGNDLLRAHLLIACAQGLEESQPEKTSISK